MAETNNEKGLSIIEEAKKFAVSLMDSEDKSPEMVVAISKLLEVLKDWY